jgi:hypothetical protein
MTPEERGKIILLGVGFLFCVGLGVACYVYIRSGSAAPPQPVEGTTPAAVAPDGPPIEIRSVPLFPEEEAAEIENFLREDLGKRPAPADGVAATDPAVFDYLVDQVMLNARLLNLDASGFDAAPDVAKILEDPGAHRGKCIAVTGELHSLEKTPYAGPVRQVQEVRRGTVRDAGGRLWTFSWPVANALEPDPVKPGEGWVRLNGLFYKSWPVADGKDPAKTETTAHLVLQRAPQRDYPQATVRDIETAWMEQVRDAEASDMLAWNEDPFFLLLNLTKNLGPTGFEGWLKAKQDSAPGPKPVLWPPEDFTGRYRELLDRPDAHRFQPIRYTGFLVRPTEVTRSEIRPNPGNVGRLWVGYLVDRDWVPAVWVYSHRSFVDQGFKTEDHVIVDGIFYKRIAYQPAKGGPLNRAAVMIAGRITQAPLPAHGMTRSFLLLIIGLMVLFAGALAWLLLQNRKDDRLAQERRREKAARRRKEPIGPAAGAAGGSAPPGTPPAAGGTPGA